MQVYGLIPTSEWMRLAQSEPRATFENLPEILNAFPSSVYLSSPS